MSKAILVLDEMPKKCYKCRFSRVDKEPHCVAVKGYQVIPFEYIGSKPDWCPLKTFPEKMDICGTYTAEYRANGGWMPSMKIGWNKCVDYLIGEEETLDENVENKVQA